MRLNCVRLLIVLMAASAAWVGPVSQVLAFAPGGTPMACSTDADCTDADFPFCNTAKNTCVRCLVGRPGIQPLFCTVVVEVGSGGVCHSVPNPVAG